MPGQSMDRPSATQGSGCHVVSLLAGGYAASPRAMAPDRPRAGRRSTRRIDQNPCATALVATGRLHHCWPPHAIVDLFVLLVELSVLLLVLEIVERVARSRKLSEDIGRQEIDREDQQRGYRVKQHRYVQQERYELDAEEGAAVGDGNHGPVSEEQLTYHSGRQHVAVDPPVKEQGYGDGDGQQLVSQVREGQLSHQLESVVLGEDVVDELGALVDFVAARLAKLVGVVRVAQILGHVPETPARL